MVRLAANAVTASPYLSDGGGVTHTHAAALASGRLPRCSVSSKQTVYNADTVSSLMELYNLAIYCVSLRGVVLS